MSDAFVVKMKEFCDKAVAENKMTRIQRFRINMKLLLPNVRKELESALTLELALQGEATVNGLIDWDNIDVDKLIQIIEVIMQLIEFISKLT